ncbi:MAG TPA: CBS domain-containing protein [Caulobacteraceae bacterium]|nr:CBS domain-containing protein [Caulobacteraceae bacterium]
MLVSQILNGKGAQVFSCSPHETLAAAAQQLAEHRIGAMVVMDDKGQVTGIISERDIVRAVAGAGARALSSPVQSFMSRGIIYAEPRETVDTLLSRMTDRRIRHLPVCHNGHLMGVVSIGDLVKAKIAEAEAEAEGLKAYITQG